MKKNIALALLILICGFHGMASVSVADVNKIINDVAAKYAPDKRQAVYEISVIEIPDGKMAVTGKLSDRSTYDELSNAIKSLDSDIKNFVRLLPETQWAQPKISVASVRVNPSHAAEMATQAIMGQPVRVLEKNGEWIRIQTPDGYIGWVPASSLALKTSDEMEKWRKADRLVVSTPFQTRAWADEKTQNLREVVTDLVNGNIVEGKYNPKQKRTQVELPDGRTGWVETSALIPINTWAAQNFDADVILDMAYSMEGTPYLWGGTSAKTLDCSGLAKVSYLANGIILMRDASQQALTGKRIEAEDWVLCEPGDLLFFGNADTGKVTHVAIYDNNGDYVHSSGRVKRNSVNPESEGYLTTPFLHAVRINGFEGSPGITRVRDHSWYFNQPAAGDHQ